MMYKIACLHSRINLSKVIEVYFFLHIITDVKITRWRLINIPTVVVVGMAVTIGTIGAFVVGGVVVGAFVGRGVVVGAFVGRGVVVVVVVVVVKATTMIFLFINFYKMKTHKNNINLKYTTFTMRIISRCIQSK